MTTWRCWPLQQSSQHPPAVPSHHLLPSLTPLPLQTSQNEFIPNEPQVSSAAIAMSCTADAVCSYALHMDCNSDDDDDDHQDDDQQLTTTTTPCEEVRAQSCFCWTDLQGRSCAQHQPRVRAAAVRAQFVASPPA